MYRLYTCTSYINYILKERAFSVPSPNSLIPPNFILFFFSYEFDFPRLLEYLHQLQICKILFIFVFVFRLQLEVSYFHRLEMYYEPWQS